MANSEGFINHYGAVRLRVKGSATFRMRLLSLDEVKIKTLVPLTLVALAYKEPTRVTNFTQQRAQLELSTTAINEYFEVTKIIVFTKLVAENYPG